MRLPQEKNREKSDDRLRDCQRNRCDDYRGDLRNNDVYADKNAL